MVERSLCMREVMGSNPITSKKLFFPFCLVLRPKMTVDHWAGRLLIDVCGITISIELCDITQLH